jgi:hypothetical protein
MSSLSPAAHDDLQRVIGRRTKRFEVASTSPSFAAFVNLHQLNS